MSLRESAVLVVHWTVLLSVVLFQSVVILKLSLVREIAVLAVLRIVDLFDALSLNVKREKN